MYDARPPASSTVEVEALGARDEAAVLGPLGRASRHGLPLVPVLAPEVLGKVDASNEPQRAERAATIVALADAPSHTKQADYGLVDVVVPGLHAVVEKAPVGLRAGLVVSMLDEEATLPSSRPRSCISRVGPSGVLVLGSSSHGCRVVAPSIGYAYGTTAVPSRLATSCVTRNNA